MTPGADTAPVRGDFAEKAQVDSSGVDIARSHGGERGGEQGPRTSFGSPRAPRPATPSRRNVLKGAAWVTPAVVVAASTPAFAASTPSTGGGAAAGVILRADDFGGLRVLLASQRPLVVNDIKIHNDGLVPLEAGQLIVTIETPVEWGTGLGWDERRAGQVLPNEEWDFALQGRVATFTSRPGANAIAPGTYIDPLPAGLDWAWTLDSDAVSSGTKEIVVTLSVVDQPNVRVAKYVRAFTGNSWLSTIDMEEVDV